MSAQNQVDVVGVDRDGDKVARYTDGDFTMLYPLTPCCGASGKGMMDDATGEGFVGCRSCYREVDPKYGSVYTEADVVGGLLS